MFTTSHMPLPLYENYFEAFMKKLNVIYLTTSLIFTACDLVSSQYLYKGDEYSLLVDLKKVEIHNIYAKLKIINNSAEIIKYSNKNLFFNSKTIPIELL